MTRGKSPARVPANTPHAARQRYTQFLQGPLSCISRAVWSVGPAIRGEVDEWLLLLPKDEPIALQRSKSPAGLRLYAAQRFVTVADPRAPGEFKTTTREYIYKLLDRNRSLVEWHWHPRQRPEPHLHSKFGESLSAWGEEAERLHLPTSRVPFEEVVRFLITDVSVRPLRDDWETVLEEALAAFRRWRTWPATGEATQPAEVESSSSTRPKKTRRRRG